VRKLQRELRSDDVDVLLINIHTEVGQAVLDRFAFELTPTFIVYDAGGSEVWRGNVDPGADRVRQLIEID
jgi:hypothetical protein